MEELLQAAQDELLLKLSFDSYISRVSLDYIDSDLDRCLTSTQKISTFLLILILISSRVRQRRWKSFFKQSRTNCFSSFPLIPTSPKSLPTTSTSILTVASKHSKNLDLPPHPHPLFLNLNLNLTNRPMTTATTLISLPNSLLLNLRALLLHLLQLLVLVLVWLPTTIYYMMKKKKKMKMTKWRS